MIKYVVGDLLEAPQTIIVHQVNCQGVMGSGVAKAIKEKYPEAYSEYKNIIDDCLDYEISYGERFGILGLAQFVKINKQRIVCNLFGQYNFTPRTRRHTDYEALRKGFNIIRDYSEEDIAMPKIGCGLGGGDWKIVSAIIESVFDDRDVYIYSLE